MCGLNDNYDDYDIVDPRDDCDHDWGEPKETNEGSWIQKCKLCGLEEYGCRYPDFNDPDPNSYIYDWIGDSREFED